MLLLASLCSIIVPLSSECELDGTIPAPFAEFSYLVALFASGLLSDSSEKGLLCHLIWMNSTDAEINCSDV